MKKAICIFLILALFLPILGCTGKKSEMTDPINFYYRRQTLTYSNTDSVISKETHDAGATPKNYSSLLSQYLKGPVDSNLQPTFPADSNLISLYIEDTTAFIVLGDTFAALTGLDLSIACVCLTMTVCELTGAQQVSISTQTALLSGNKTITMSLDDIVLTDDSSIAIAPD